MKDFWCVIHHLTKGMCLGTTAIAFAAMIIYPGANELFLPGIGLGVLCLVSKP